MYMMSSGNTSCEVVLQGKLFGNGKGCWEVMQLRDEAQPEPKAGQGEREKKRKKKSNSFGKILRSKLACLGDTHSPLPFLFC